MTFSSHGGRSRRGRICLKVRYSRRTEHEIDIPVEQRLLCNDVPTAISMRTFFDSCAQGTAVAITLASARAVDEAALQEAMRQEQYPGQIYMHGHNWPERAQVYHGARMMVTDNLDKTILSGAQPRLRITGCYTQGRS